MNETLKRLRRVKKKGGCDWPCIAWPYIARFLSDTLSSYRDTIGLHLYSCNNTSLATKFKASNIAASYLRADRALASLTAFLLPSYIPIE